MVSVCLAFAGACSGEPETSSSGTETGSGTTGATSESSASESTTSSASATSTSPTGGMTEGTTGTTTTATTQGPSPTTSDPSTSSTSDSSSTGDCACDPGQVCTPDGCRGGQIYIAFDGPTMVAGNEDDATMNQTGVGMLAGPKQGYGGTEAQWDEFVELVRDRFIGISVYITRERPEEGPYSMLVLGPNLANLGALEISLQDCGNANPNSVSFVHIEATDQFSITDRVTVTAHAAGHGSGLEHLDDPNAIMFGMLSSDASFQDECLPIGMNQLCPNHVGCPNGQQNSFAELVDTYGPL